MVRKILALVAVVLFVSGTSAFALSLSFNGVPDPNAGNALYMNYFSSPLITAGDTLTSLSLHYALEGSSKDSFTLTLAGIPLLTGSTVWSGTLNITDASTLTALRDSLVSVGYLQATAKVGQGNVRFIETGNNSLSGNYNNVTPEPATMLLMGAGLAGLPVVRRFRRKSEH